MQYSETRFATERARALFLTYELDTDAAVVVSATANEVGLPEDLETDRALAFEERGRGSHKLAVMATLMHLRRSEELHLSFRRWRVHLTHAHGLARFVIRRPDTCRQHMHESERRARPKYYLGISPGCAIFVTGSVMQVCGQC